MALHLKKLVLLFLIVPFVLQAQECRIVFGVSQTTYKPYSWMDENGKIQGLNIELFEALVSKTNCLYEIETMPWTDLTKRFEDGTVNVIASSQSPFPDSFKGQNVMQIPINIAFYGYFYTRTESEGIRTLEDLNGKEVLVLDKSVGFDYLNNLGDEYDITVRPYPSTESALAALSGGQGDAAMFSLTAAMNIIENEHYANIKVSGRPIFPAPYGFLVHREDIEVFDTLSIAMEELKAEGTYFDIMKKWQLSQDTGALWVKRLLTGAAVLFIVILVIVVWNKMLQEKVRQKTEELSNEMEQRRLAEQENLQLREEAMISGKLAVLGEMATSIIHEINNPTGLIIHNVSYLNSINAEIRKLLGNLASGNDKIHGMQWREAVDDVDDALITIDESISRVTKTISELKSYIREQPDISQVIDLKECINIAVGLTRYFIKEYTDNFSLEFAGDDIFIFGNMLHIEQVVINLVYNACYALTGKDQAIRCILDKDVVIDNVNYARVSVIDNGRGMSEKVQGKLFTPFFTTRKDLGGTGIGMAIINRVVKEHNGFVKVYSEEGKGTEVAVFLPLHMDKE